jgi:hypothetical protein
MPFDQSRALEIDGPPLDASAIVLGTDSPDAGIGDPPHPHSPAVLWQGAMASDGTGPQMSYFVRLYADGSATCQCPAFYFRATLKRDARYFCKHVQRARTRTGTP